MIKSRQCAADVRVKLNENWKPKSLGEQYLQEEDIIYIGEGNVYNDLKGDYVYIRGGSGFNSGTAYLSELDLEFPIQHTGYIPASMFPKEGLKKIVESSDIEKMSIQQYIEHLNSDYNDLPEGYIYISDDFYIYNIVVNDNTKLNDLMKIKNHYNSIVFVKEEINF